MISFLDFAFDVFLKPNADYPARVDVFGNAALLETLSLAVHADVEQIVARPCVMLEGKAAA